MSTHKGDHTKTLTDKYKTAQKEETQRALVVLSVVFFYRHIYPLNRRNNGASITATSEKKKGRGKVTLPRDIKVTSSILYRMDLL